MNLIEQWRANQEFKKIVRELDVSNGVPSYPNVASGSDLETYLHQLARVDLGLKEIVDQPQKVFYGEARGREHAMLIRTRRDFPPQFPPRTTYQAELPVVITTQVEPTLEHITRLAAINLNIDPKDQRGLVAQTINSLKENRRFSFTDFGDNWTLRLVVENSAGDDSWITPRLIPVEKGSYSADWIKRKTKNFKRTIRPESLGEQVDKAAEDNFCVRDVTMAEVDSFDLGGNVRMDEIIEKAGYREADINDHALDYRATARPSAMKIYCHEDLEPDETAPLLGVKKSIFGDNTFKLLALVPQALSAEIRSEFQKKFQFTAGEIVKNRIKTGLKSAEDVNLNPDDVTTETLKKLEHHIVSDDYHDQLDWLCSIALEQTLKEFSRYPKTKDAVALLRQARKLSAAAQRIDDVLAEDAGNRDAQFTLGWKPDEVALSFPAAYFRKP